MTNWNDLPLTLSTKQTAKILGIIRIGTVQKMCKDGILPAAQMGHLWRVDRDRLRLMFAAKNAATLPQRLVETEFLLRELAGEKGASGQALAEAHAAIIRACELAK